MKVRFYLFFILIASSFAFAEEAEVCFVVEGMTCSACREKIEEHVKKEAGIKSVEVSLRNNQAKILYENTKSDQEKIKAQVIKAGYKVTDLKCLK